MPKPRLRFQAAALRSSDPRPQRQVSPELPACPANLGLVSRHDHASQFLKRNPSLYIYICISLVLFLWRTLTSTGMTCHPSSRVLGALLLTLLLCDPPSLQPSVRAQKEGLGRENTTAHPLPWNNCVQMATLLIHSLQVTTDEGCSQGPGLLHEGTGAIGASRPGCLYVSVDHALDTSLSLHVKYAVCAVMRSIR